MKLLNKEMYKNHCIEIYEHITRRDDVQLGLSYTDEIIRIDGVTQIRSGPLGETAMEEARRLVDEAEEDVASLYDVDARNLRS